VKDQAAKRKNIDLQHKRGIDIDFDSDENLRAIAGHQTVTLELRNFLTIHNRRKVYWDVTAIRDTLVQK